MLLLLLLCILLFQALQTVCPNVFYIMSYFFLRNTTGFFISVYMEAIIYCIVYFVDRYSI